jgi:histone-lysine N-methyltransferase SETMAR
LLRRIRRKKENTEEEGIFRLHDNATPHTSKISTEAISRLGFIPLFYPPYSPDLAPSDYVLFPKLKKHLATKKFSTNEEVKKKEY